MYYFLDAMFEVSTSIDSHVIKTGRLSRLVLSNKTQIFCDTKNISSPPLHLHVTHLIKMLEAAVCNSLSNIKWVEKIFELDVVDEALFHSALMLCDVLSKFHSFFTLLNYDNQLS